MSRNMWLRLLVVALAVAPIAILPQQVSAQEGGTVSGSVVDEATQGPLVGAQVTIAGTNRGTITNQEGGFVILNVAEGPREVRTNLIGYSAGSEVVDVGAGQTATVSFELRSTAIPIEGVMVTATGETQRRRELGTTVGTIAVADIELARVNTVAQLLTARSPGVTVQLASGNTGGSQRIRIRGSNSVSLSNEPLLIIDGVRLNNSAESSSIATGGQTISRLNDLNPDEIENIEILKGPSAAAMYGTAAANGVIQITTRRGRAGTARWSFYTEGGYLWDPTEYPENWGRFGTISGATNRGCTLFRISTGVCTDADPDVFSFAPLEAASPFRESDNILGLDQAGARTKFGGSVSGGTDAVTYFFSGDREKEQGIYPTNDMERVSLRANASVRLRDDLNLDLTSGWLHNEINSPQGDNNLIGTIAGALLGRSVDDDDLRGYAGATPEQLEQLQTRQEVRRFTGGANLNYRPRPWLSLVSQSGIDAVFRHDGQTLPAETIFSSVNNARGSRTSDRAEILNFNTQITATGSYAVTDRITGQSSVGAQYQRELFQRTDAFGRQLLPGTTRLPGTSAEFAVDEEFEDNRTVGGYLQQQFAFEDRIFLTAALRGDDNSAFGSDFGLVTYPSVMGSWMIAEEGFFPEQNIVSTLKLRAAYGESGLRPTFRDALSFFTPVGATQDDGDVPAFTVGGIGDPELKPEKTREFEFGFDAGLLDERLGFEVTYYDKRSSDALVFRPLAPSIGAARDVLGNLRTGRFENVGVVSNQGWEFMVRAQPIDLPNVAWELTGTFSTNTNELVELGEGIEPILFGLGGATQRHTPGYPIGGYWFERLTGFEDANGDGIIQHTEVQISEDAEFLGNPTPGREFAVSTSATFFNLVRLSAQIDGRSDYVLNNSTRYFRCASAFLNCRESFDPTAPLEDQARAISAQQAAGFDARGTYFEDASFVKLREVALTLSAPDTWINRARLTDLSVTFAGRNLRTWTDYTGFDPEVNWAGGSNQSVSDFNTQPPLRYFTTRLNVSF